MAAVVDASLAFKWLKLEDDSDRAFRLWRRWQQLGEEVIAPPVFRAEILNALHQQVRKQLVDLEDAERLHDTALRIVAMREPSGLYALALQLASEYRLPATYDALYLALGQLQRCEIWTADRRFADRVSGRIAMLHTLDEIA